MATPEHDHTLSLLSSPRTVLGFILMSRGHPYGIVRQSGVIFDGEHGRKYAAAIGKIMENVQSSLEELSDEPNDGVRLMLCVNTDHELRTKSRHEVMISPVTRMKTLL